MEFYMLEHFLAVAREGSILGAANALHMTQPNLSRQMKELENEVGKQLFIRSNRHITLTEEGLLLRERANEIVALVNKTQAELSEDEATLRGDVFICAGEMDTFHCLTNVMHKIREEGIDICFRLSSGDAEEIVRRLDIGLIDFGLLIEPFDLQKYNFQRLPQVETVGLIMRKDDPLAEKASIKANDLKSIPLLVPDQFQSHGYLSKWLGITGDELNIAATGDLPYNVVLAVRDGLGYMIGVDLSLFTEGADSKICFRPFSPPLTSNVYLIWKKHQPLSKASQYFLSKFLNVTRE